MHILLFFILIALIFPGLIRLISTIVGLAIVFCVVAVVAHAEPAAVGYQREDLVKAESLLDDYCRGSTDADVGAAKVACDARDAIYKALYRDGWCFGKKGQPESEERWHRCGKNSNRDNGND